MSRHTNLRHIVKESYYDEDYYEEYGMEDDHHYNYGEEHYHDYGDEKHVEQLKQTKKKKKSKRNHPSICLNYTIQSPSTTTRR
jgi:hypothetical protein